MNKQIDYGTKVLEVKDLRQHFKVGVGKNKLTVRAVDGISFDVYKKEVFGLVGESGCGKTTTGRTIMRLYKPTNGTVILNGNIIGSGSYDLKRLLRIKKQEHNLNLLKLNKHGFEVHLIKEKYNKLNRELDHQINILKKEQKASKSKISSALKEYANTVFNEKESYEVLLERLSFNFRLEKDKLSNLTKNPAKIEYDSLMKGLKLAFEKKLEGIKESAALSKEGQAKHVQEIREDYEERLKVIKEEMLPKIQAAEQSKITKQEYKQQLNILEKKYKEQKEQAKLKHKTNLENFVKPDKNKITNEIKIIEKEYAKEIEKLEEEIKNNHTLQEQEISKVSSEKNIDKSAMEKIEKEYREFRETTIAQIKQSRAVQRSKEAEKNVKAMQMIFQDPISSLNPRMTVQEIVSEGLVINGVKDKEFIKKEVIKTLELVGLAPEYISRYPHEFSGGQRQRIGIARALIMNPSIIIADEPISALDVSIKAQVINLLSELREKLDLSILFIAHDLSVVKFFCDRIAVMYFGKIVELASSEELFKNPLHPYTQSLLSAIPHPDPESEKTRQRINYNPAMHDYRIDKPSFVEIKEGHFILANEKELAEMRQRLGVENEKK